MICFSELDFKEISYLVHYSLLARINIFYRNLFFTFVISSFSPERNEFRKPFRFIFRKNSTNSLDNPKLTYNVESPWLFMIFSSTIPVIIFYFSWSSKGNNYATYEKYNLKKLLTATSTLTHNGKDDLKYCFDDYTFPRSVLKRNADMRFKFVLSLLALYFESIFIIRFLSFKEKIIPVSCI